MDGLKYVMSVLGISLHKGTGGDWEERWTARLILGFPPLVFHS